MTIRRMLLLSLFCATLGAMDARADGPPREGLWLTSVRSWPSPTSTRVVFDFTLPVVPVAPDSGVSNQLVVSVPGEALSVVDSVRTAFGVHDGVVDSVEITTPPEGARFRIWFHDTTDFRAFTVPAEADKSFRLVVDVSRPGAEAALERRFAALAAEKKRDRVRIITVDAGHGGEDTGARGPRPRSVLEKTVTLAVARKLVDELNQITGIKAQLTRDGDYFIPLRERYRIAERMKADLFISIHCNSSRRRGAGSGTEVYFLSVKGASDQADADLADVENAADMVGGVPSQAEDDVVNILYDVKRSDAMQRSQLLAESLLEHLAADRKLESRGVKQAGFAVLKSVEFPSVLVETAFINNSVEARLLANPDFQRQIARQLSTGVRSYFERAGIALGANLSGPAAEPANNRR